MDDFGSSRAARRARGGGTGNALSKGAGTGLELDARAVSEAMDELSDALPEDDDEAAMT